MAVDILKIRILMRLLCLDGGISPVHLVDPIGKWWSDERGDRGIRRGHVLGRVRLVRTQRSVLSVRRHGLVGRHVIELQVESMARLMDDMIAKLERRKRVGHHGLHLKMGLRLVLLPR